MRRHEWRLTRDILIAATGIFMLVHETFELVPNKEIIAAALVLLGFIPILRYRDRVNDKNNN